MDLFQVFVPCTRLEYLSSGSQSELANLNFLLFVIFVFFSLIGNQLLNSALNLLKHSLVSLLLNSRFLLELSNLAITVGNQGCLLCTLPVLSEKLDNLQHETLLLISEGAVLAHSVEADDELLLLRNERLVINFVKCFSFFLKWLIGRVSSFSALVLLFLECVDLFLEFGLLS